MSGYGDPAPVHTAVAAGKSAAEVRRLIEEQALGSAECRAQAASQPFVDESPLEAAIRLERPDLVGVLLEAGADVKPLYQGLATPLAVCALHGTAESLRALLRAGHDAREKIGYDCYVGFGSHQPSATAAHLCLSPPWSRSSPTPAPRLEALEVLVTEGGVDADARDEHGGTLLMWLPFARSDHEAALDLLLVLGADVNARSWAKKDEPNQSPLLSLLSNFRGPVASLLPCVRKLVAAGAAASGVFNRRGVSPLAAAMVKGDAAVLQFLLEEVRVPVNERDPASGKTALHHCDYLSSPLGVSMLLDAGADVAVRDDRGRTAVFAAAPVRPRRTLERLLERGASVDVFDEDNNTPLIVACAPEHMSDQWHFFSSAEAVELLLRRSSPETIRAVRKSDNYTALDCIVKELHNREEIFRNHFLERLEDLDSDDDDVARDPPLLYKNLDPPQLRVICEMLAAGVPFLAEHADVLLPLFVEMIAPRAEGAAVEMADRVCEAHRWRAHEDVVGLALDAKEAREVEAEVEAAEMRLAALERRLREREEEVGTTGRREAATGEGEKLMSV